MTTLESILSNLVHVPVKLVDVEAPRVSVRSLSDAPTFDFGMKAILDTEARRKDVYVPDDDIPFCDEDCSNCPIDCEEDEWDDDEPMMWGIPDVERVIFSPPATIVFWTDGTKTVVKCMEGEKYEKYAGFAMACMKKLFGSTSRAKAIMNEVGDDQKAKEEETKKEKPVFPYEADQLTFPWEHIVKVLFSDTCKTQEEKKDETSAE